MMNSKRFTEDAISHCTTCNIGLPTCRPGEESARPIDSFGHVAEVGRICVSDAFANVSGSPTGEFPYQECLAQQVRISQNHPPTRLSGVSAGFAENAAAASDRDPKVLKMPTVSVLSASDAARQVGVCHTSPHPHTPSLKARRQSWTCKQSSQTTSSQFLDVSLLWRFAEELQD